MTGDGCDPTFPDDASKAVINVAGPPYIRAIFMRESLDGGYSWSPIRHVVGGDDLYGKITSGPVSNPTTVYDEKTHTLLLAFSADYGFPGTYDPNPNLTPHINPNPNPNTNPNRNPNPNPNPTIQVPICENSDNLGHEISGLWRHLGEPTTDRRRLRSISWRVTWAWSRDSVEAWTTCRYLFPSQ